MAQGRVRNRSVCQHTTHTARWSGITRKKELWVSGHSLRTQVRRGDARPNSGAVPRGPRPARSSSRSLSGQIVRFAPRPARWSVPVHRSPSGSLDAGPRSPSGSLTVRPAIEESAMSTLPESAAAPSKPAQLMSVTSVRDGRRTQPGPPPGGRRGLPADPGRHHRPGRAADRGQAPPVEERHSLLRGAGAGAAARRPDRRGLARLRNRPDRTGDACRGDLRRARRPRQSSPDP